MSGTLVAIPGNGVVSNLAKGRSDNQTTGALGYRTAGDWWTVRISRLNSAAETLENPPRYVFEMR